jgi:aspartate aminotransferase-like enzyme
MSLPKNNDSLLLTPGPTQIPQRIFDAMAQRSLHHRSKEFEGEFRQALENLKWLTQSQEMPILLAASGSGAMEAALLNTTQAGDRIVVLNGGVFGERWKKIAERLSLTISELTIKNLGDSFDLNLLAHLLTQLKESGQAAKLVAFQYVETSTTTMHPALQIGEVIKRTSPNTLSVVDAISTLLTTPISAEHDKFDIIVGGSQKAFMLPPGLSFLILSGAAWQVVEKNSHNHRSLYFDLLLEKKQHQLGTSAWTPAMNTILGLNEAFRMVKEEGLENVYSRHAQLSTLARKRFSDLGFKLLTQAYPATSVTGAFPPNDIDSEKLRSDLQEKFAIQIAGGQAALSGKIIRLGHMGCITESDLERCFSGIEALLN